MNYPRVSIIILNWNGKENTINCLEALKLTTYSNYETIVVDNGSTDGSTKYFKDNYPGIKLIENRTNLGFAEGNNVAIREVLIKEKSKYISLLNNDTIVKPDWLEKLVEALESDEKIGSCQPKILSLINPDMIDAVGISIDRYGGAAQEGHNEKDLGQYDQITEVFGVCAGAALYRAKMLGQIGLFDEDFFAYYEDVDLAIRARLFGWKSACIPQAVIYHIHSATLGNDSPFKRYLLERNSYYYVIKNLPMKTIMLFFISKVRSTFFSLISLTRNKKFSLIKSLIKGNLDALRNFPIVISKRAEIQAKRSISEEDFKMWLK
ncbi:glycosyltransferase [Methanosarcina sp. DH2]|uniref:glycosyltransferase family 2 protein n=1 Tax=Methanosarcina sp. DH2 TaxID=2605639 RepID=UPI001E2B80E7|nr:glycosyltransferase family 2 protein [Methanosarcina sp. DH2]MCC4770979.1 glycosyltransferase [Methanosarcina sp. DH2]